MSDLYSGFFNLIFVGISGACFFEAVKGEYKSKLLSMPIELTIDEKGAEISHLKTKDENGGGMSPPKTITTSLKKVLDLKLNNEAEPPPINVETVFKLAMACSYIFKLTGVLPFVLYVLGAGYYLAGKANLLIPEAKPEQMTYALLFAAFLMLAVHLVMLWKFGVCKVLDKLYPHQKPHNFIERVITGKFQIRDGRS